MNIMQAYFEPEQAFSMNMPQPVFEILITYKEKHVCDPHRYICSLQTPSVEDN